ncbi:MAG: hypothetical protein H6728_13015 [Myxococcales bacterium]|nr:hypothetical protein [Myxococcales bacterium]
MHLAYRFLFLFFLCGVVVNLPQTALAQTQQKLLFVGNSYTFGNDPLAINQQTTAMFQEAFPASEPHHQIRVAAGGKLWEQHLADLEDTTKDLPLRQYLVTSQDPLHKWTWVIFQEQSQIPGIEQTDGYWQRSAAAIEKLTAAAHQRGAQSILLMTWGRREGDAQNQHIFPDFKTMQDRLRDGYLLYRSRSTTPQNTVYIAPAGIAWAYLYDTIKASGQDPLQSDSLWYRLYVSDGSHPSILGTYLASATIFAAITGRDPRTLRYNPNQQIEEKDRTALLEAAYQAVLQNKIPNLPFPTPFASPEPVQEATPEPTQEPAANEPIANEPIAEKATEPTKEASPEATTPDATTPEAQTSSPKQGCCHATPAPFDGWGALILLGLGLILLVRRSHRNQGA